MTSILSPELSTTLTLLLYAVAGAVGIGAMIARSATVRRVGAVAAVVGFALQTAVLFLGFHGSTHGGLSVGAYLQMMAWFVVLCGIVLWLTVKQEMPLIFGALLALILYGFSAPSLQEVVRMPARLNASFYALHIGALFLSIALIAIACAAGAAFLCLDYRLKNRKGLPAFLRDVPALNILDRINALATMVGFPLFTVGIICGLFYAKPVFGGTVTGDPKEIISIAVWALLALLFYNRLARGWYGRKPARLMGVIFALCVFSIVGVNVFMDSHHAFTRN